MATLSTEILAQVRRLHIVTKHRVQEALAGAYHSVFKGQGIEFEDVRGYQPGDDIRSIDWNVTARSNFPHIKRFREERELTVVLVVDISGSIHFGSGEKTKRERMAEIGALLCLAAIENGDRVSLLLCSDTVELYLPPRKGKRHALRVIREIIAGEARSKGTHIRSALEYLQRVQKRHAICCVLSDFMTPDFHEAATLAARRYDLIALHITDPHEVTLPSLGLLELVDSETGESLLVDSSDPEVSSHLSYVHKKHADALKATIERMGAGYISLDGGEPAVDVLHRYFTTRSRRR